MANFVDEILSTFFGFFTSLYEFFFGSKGILSSVGSFLGISAILSSLLGVAMCPKFIGWTYVHITAALLLLFLSTEITIFSFSNRIGGIKFGSNASGVSFGGASLGGSSLGTTDGFADMVEDIGTSLASMAGISLDSQGSSMGGESSGEGPSLGGSSIGSKGISLGGISLGGPNATIASNSLAGFLGIVQKYYMEIIQHLLLTILLIVLAFVVLTIEQGFMKYLAFLLLLVFSGQNLRGYVEIFHKQEVLRDILVTLIGTAFAMACAGFHDTNNTMDMSGYLLASLSGLFITAFLLFLSDQQQHKPPFTNADKIAYGGITTLIALYMAFDTRTLKAMAKNCTGKPDYVAGALQTYLDLFKGGKTNRA